MNSSKILLVAFLAINGINSQSFAADKSLQSQNFFHKAKVFMVALTIGATSTLAASPVDVKLDEDSKINLLKQVKKENVARGYWPEEASVRLERFYIKEGLNHEPKYCCRVVGSYKGFIKDEQDSGETLYYPAMLGKPTEGCFFSENELQSYGVILPEEFQDVQIFQELNTTNF